MKSIIKLVVKLLATLFPTRFLVSEVPYQCAGNKRGEPLRSVSWNNVIGKQ